MDFGCAERRNGLTMLGCRIPLVLRKSVVGIGFAEFNHQCVARRFSDNGGRGDGDTQTVAPWNRLSDNGGFGKIQPVYQQVIGRRREISHSLLHRYERRL